MAPARKKTHNIARRRRLDDEDDTRSVASVADDSQTDPSVLSDAGEGADADLSDLSDVESAPSSSQAPTKRKENRIREAKVQQEARHQPSTTPATHPDTVFAVSKETDMMRNGLTLPEISNHGEELDFETLDSLAKPAPSHAESMGERRRREHEAYKKKRDSDSAFTPNRGAFFMHDQRRPAAQHGFRPGGGRGRGRDPSVGGPFSPSTFVPHGKPWAKDRREADHIASARTQAPEVTDSPWQHDLHETINAPTSQPPTAAPPASFPVRGAVGTAQSSAKGLPMSASKSPPNRNFSATVHTHNALVRVFLPNMKAPIHFQNVPIKQHTRLPNHRPPLRRDKPVRISLPPAAARYIFPAIERSFIFIPRALRPNQHGLGRGRGRFGSLGGAGFSSRRTSACGGSAYSPSVAVSRRSSIVREMGRDALASPVGSIMSRNGGFVDPSRPVVRLPPGGSRVPTGLAIISPSNPIPVSNPAQPPYPLPQKPAYRENWQGQLPMHQPRPQKAVSVAGIESPASINFHPPQQQEQQPFHQQVPAHVNGTSAISAPPSEQQSFYPHNRQSSYPGQVSTGTPLSNIPERAIHAPTFQPYTQPGFPPPSFVPQSYYCPPNGNQPQYMGPTNMVPMFVPGAQQPSYMMPVATTSTAPSASALQPNMVAYESNGMTYYVDSTHLYPQPAMESYAQPSYAVPGMGGMMTPGPDGAFYYPQTMQQATFYPTQ